MRSLPVLDAPDGAPEAAPSGLVRGRIAQLDAATRQARAALPVALVSMPFVDFRLPSIQIGLLKAIVGSHGFPVAGLNLNLDFARQLEPALYSVLSQHRGRMWGDWLFSIAAFGDQAPDPTDRLADEYGHELRHIFDQFDVQGSTSDVLRRVRHEEVPRYLDMLLETIAWHQFRMVGFSSTFQQSVASFALAGRLKRHYPEITTFFGGANFEGEMGSELVRSVECIDYAIIGEGDQALPAFLIAIQEGRDPASVSGVVRRDEGGVTPYSPRPPLRDLDDLPTPDYSDYFRRAEALGLLEPHLRRKVRIPYESGRGCWWGDKHQCTFCGLNGLGIAFRAKSADRVLEELGDLARQCHSFNFEAVDNIVSVNYLKDLFPRITEAGFDYHLFYEVKANLTREQLKTLALGGVKHIQPGIESLNTHVLRLMSKGITAIQNVNTLRWASHYGMNVSWNILFGFPGETVDDYVEQVALLRRLGHLRPPQACSRIWMERFSPIFQDREKFPTRFLRAETSYGYVYPSSVQLDKIAYFFDYELENTLPDDAFGQLMACVESWTERWRQEPRPQLRYWSADGLLQIDDSRDPASSGTYTFDDPLASIYVACSDRPLTATAVRTQLDLPWPVLEIEEALDRFCELGLMMRDGQLFLSLALPVTPGR